MVRFGAIKQVILLVLSLAGLTVCSAIIQSIQLRQYTALNPDATLAMMYAYLSSVPALFLSNVGAYTVLAVVMLIIVFLDRREFFRSFKGWKPYVYGIVGFIAIIAFGYLYSAIVSLIYAGIGREIPGTNNNQSILNEMIVYRPVVCFLVFGLVGPFTEELGYRVGLFGLLSRFGKWAGYISSIIIFAAIHFDFSAFGTPAIESELISLPSYLFSGFAFAFIYQKAGFAASFTAHAMNNIFSIAVNYIQGTMQS